MDVILNDKIVNEEGIESNISLHKISVAPMLGVTTPQFRYMMRLLTKHTMLYTDMIHHDTILLNNYQKILEYNDFEHPIVIQLGGNDPKKLEDSAKLCRELKYDEINLNCGCPSSKVQEYEFGAVLMKNPDLVANIAKLMRNAFNGEVTIKCRLGLDKNDDDFLNNFIETVNSKGNVNHFIMHARLAIMDLDPVRNRSIPPLEYKKVFDLKKKYNSINFSINGGFREVKKIEEILIPENNLYGCMIGRAAYDNPWMFSDFDRLFYKKKNPGLTKREVLYQYADYCDKLLETKPKSICFELVKPILYLMNGEILGSFFRNELITIVKYFKEDSFVFSDFIKTCMDNFYKVNYKALDRKVNND